MKRHRCVESTSALIIREANLPDPSLVVDTVLPLLVPFLQRRADDADAGAEADALGSNVPCS
jgi:hypothetical protein